MQRGFPFALGYDSLFTYNKFGNEIADPLAHGLTARQKETAGATKAEKYEPENRDAG